MGALLITNTNVQPHPTPTTSFMVIVNKLHRKKVVGRWSVGGR